MLEGSGSLDTINHGGIRYDNPILHYHAARRINCISRRNDTIIARVYAVRPAEKSAFFYNKHKELAGASFLKHLPAERGALFQKRKKREREERILSKKEDTSRKGDEGEEPQEERRGAISRWRPEDYMMEMDRMFRDFTRQMQDRFSSFPDFVGSLSRPGWWFEAPDVRRPYADVVDTGNEYKVVVEVPGVPKDKLDVTVTPEGVTIKGEAQSDIREEEKKGGFVRRERSYTKVQRSVSFPEEVDSDRAEAKLNNGLVEITVPKKTPTGPKARKVEVQ